MNEKNILKYKVESKDYTFIILGGILIAIGLVLDLVSGFSNNKFIVNIFDILCPSFGFAIGIIAAIRDEDITNKFYRNLGIGFIFLAVLNILVMLAKYGYLNSINYSYINSVRMDMACIIIIVPWIVYKVNGSSYLSVSLYSIFIVIISLIHRTEGVGGLNLLTSIILISICIYLMRLNKKPRDNMENRYLYLYITFIALSQLLYYIEIKYSLKIGLYYDAIRYFAYFVIYQGCSKYLIEFVYFSAMEELENIKKDRIRLNKELSVRNKVLSEMNTSLSKSEKSTNEMLSKFGDGIILFYMERVAYVNDAALKLFNIEHREYILGAPFGKLIYLIADNLTEKNSKEYYKLVDEDYFRINNKNICIFNEIKCNDKEYEVTVLKADTLNQIIYINDTTEVSQGIKHQKRYEEIVKEREIKEGFYANISHELRTPVNVIFSALQLKDMYIRDSEYKLIEKNDRVVRQNCLRLIRTITNFIDTNKISEGKMRAEFGIYNIVSVVENIAQATIGYFDRANTTLIFDADEEEVYVRVDKLMIERVVLNLLSNSIKYGKENGLIEINIKVNKESVEILIKNNGYTIPVEAREYIFEKFTKTDNSLSRDSEGSGLGLYLVRELIYLNEGNLELLDDCYDGNEFKITLPITEEVRDEVIFEESEINTLEEKVDIEFSDVYI